MRNLILKSLALLYMFGMWWQYQIIRKAIFCLLQFMPFILGASLIFFVNNWRSKPCSKFKESNYYVTKPLVWEGIVYSDIKTSCSFLYPHNLPKDCKRLFTWWELKYQVDFTAINFIKGSHFNAPLR